MNPFKHPLIIASLVLAVVTGWMGYHSFSTASAPTHLKPIVTLHDAVPLPQNDGIYEATWTITFPVRAQVQDAVSHGDKRDVVVTRGTMLLVSDDLPNKTRVLRAGERVTIQAGAMHSWENLGKDVGELTAVGVVPINKLHDACGGAG
jgi:mannose-6-phosphate isomerase-like protein (cupin superfamily)